MAYPTGNKVPSYERNQIRARDTCADSRRLRRLLLQPIRNATAEDDPYRRDTRSFVG